MSDQTSELVPIADAVRELAAMGVRWDERTIRRHLVPADEWRGLASGDVPMVRFGTNYRIPRWWLDKIAEVIRMHKRPTPGNSDK